MTKQTPPSKYQFWSHARSGETFAVRFEGGELTGACGPLDHTEVRDDARTLRADLLPDFHYDDDAALADVVRQHADDYRLEE